MPPIFGALISRGMCTLHELRTIYTYDDVLDMYDIICTDAYNQKIMEQNERQKK